MLFRCFPVPRFQSRRLDVIDSCSALGFERLDVQPTVCLHMPIIRDVICIYLCFAIKSFADFFPYINLFLTVVMQPMTFSKPRFNPLSCTT